NLLILPHIIASSILLCSRSLSFFFFMHPGTTDIYTLSLHDALPISCFCAGSRGAAFESSTSIISERPRCSPTATTRTRSRICSLDRKSTRLNSSHVAISYAVFCLKKKKKETDNAIVAHYRKSNYSTP